MLLWWVMKMQVLSWLKFLDFKMASLSVAVMFSLYRALKHEKDKGCFTCFYPAGLHSSVHGDNWNRKDCKTYWNKFWGKMSELGLHRDTESKLSMATWSSCTPQLLFLQIFSPSYLDFFSKGVFMIDVQHMPVCMMWHSSIQVQQLLLFRISSLNIPKYALNASSHTN